MSNIIYLTPFGDILNAVGALYWLIAFGLVAIAIFKPKSLLGKAVALLVVVLIFGYFPFKSGVRAYHARQRLEAATALFEKHCKTAGVKIYREVYDVEGLLLLKVRPEKRNDTDQYALSDPYGHDLGGDGYVMTFLEGKRPDGGASSTSLEGGFRYVDTIDILDGVRYRYTARLEPDKAKYALPGSMNFILDRNVAPEERPRYGVIYDDISTKEDRYYWIAGSSLRVIDLQNNEVIGERIGFLMDRAQGYDPNGRVIWALAASKACPTFPVVPGTSHPIQYNQTRKFVEKVLHPIK